MNKSYLSIHLILSILLFFFLCQSSLMAQQQQVKLLLDQADQQAQIEKQILLDAQLLASRIGDKMGLAECHYRIALYYERMGVPELSIEELEKAQNIYHKHQHQPKYQYISQKLQNIRQLISNDHATDKQRIRQLEAELRRIRLLQNQRMIASILFVLAIVAIFYFRNQSKQSQPGAEE